MSDKYKIRDIDKAYFVTLTVVDWIDVYTRKNIHNDPVQEKIVTKPEDYLFSSTRNYTELDVCSVFV